MTGRPVRKRVRYADMISLHNVPFSLQLASEEISPEILFASLKEKSDYLNNKAFLFIVEIFSRRTNLVGKQIRSRLPFSLYEAYFSEMLVLK